MQTYLLADSISRINNAQRSHKRVVVLLFSKLLDKVLTILIKEGFIDNKIIFSEKRGIFRIQVYLKYTDSDNPVISSLKLVSRPSHRVYSSYQNIPQNHNGLGIVLLSTSLGIMTNHDAIRLKCGGEVLCSVF